MRNPTRKSLNQTKKKLQQLFKGQKIIADRVDQFIEVNSFITVKDHRPNFPSEVQCRLINPAKSNVGFISKQILEREQ